MITQFLLRIAGRAAGARQASLFLALLAFLGASAPSTEAATLWTAPTVSFSKAAFANSADPANQDYLTPGVRLTRADVEGLYNAVVQSSWDYPGPVGTEWATGTISDGVGTLSFNNWWNYVWSLGGPPEAVGVPSVLHLIDEDIYIDITVSDWGVGGGAGGYFSWERSSPNVIITLNGDTPMYLLVGTPFVDPGASAEDYLGNTISVVTSGSVNTAVRGSYLITYSAEDGNGGTYEATRVVNVVDPPCLAVMPSFTQNSTYANAALNEPITVWGRIVNGMTGPVTYTLDFGDGSSTSGPVTDQSFIGEPHTYTTSGSKTMTLTVTDGLANIYTKSAVISVINSPTHDQRINMAIEKGLLWLYQTRIEIGADQVFWNNGSYHGGVDDVGGVGGAVLCFEENGHLPINPYCDDIYAEVVQKGLNWMFNSPYAANYAISDHSDGVAVQDSDADNDGIGSYLTPLSYANGYGVLAVVLAHPNAASAMSTIIPTGPFAGTSYYDFVVDAIDQFSYSQGDGGNRGGWVYDINTPDNGRYDGSAQQWPALVFRAALDRWGLASPAWMLNNAAYGYQVLQGASGGSGYSGQSWINHAKTGGLLVAYGNAGMAVGNASVDAGVSFLGNTWYSEITTGSSGDNGGWMGELYAMYGVKKGLQLQGLTQVTTPFGVRDWYLDFSAWLLGNGTLLDAALGAGMRSISSYGFGQYADGHWQTDNQWPFYGDGTMCTINAILVLTKAVTVDVPVAQIAAVGDQIPSSSFGLNGSSSYHTDPANWQIVQYAWDFDASDGVDFDSPDATGPVVVHPGYPSTGTYTISLRVKDNQSPELFDTETIVVNVVTEDLPPVAVAIPTALLPAYAGKPGDIITLDGTSSFDPNPGDVISSYEWDLDGDASYDDASGATTTFTSPTPYVGEIGLEVTANGKTSSNSAHIDIFASTKDLYVESLTAVCVTPGTSARVRAVLRNHADSTEGFNNVVVRFYDGNPFTVGSQIGASQLVNLPIGGSATVEVDLPIAGVSTVHCYVDASFVIPEWDERNNVASVDVSGMVRRPGDINGDCCVSLADVDVLIAAIKARSTDLQYDVNGDGRVNAADAIKIRLLFTNPGGAACP